MKLKSKVWVVCDANGEFKGLYATEELAHEAADLYGAYVASTNVVRETLPRDAREIRKAMKRRQKA